MNDDAGKHVRILNPNGFAEWPVKGDRRVALLLVRMWAIQQRKMDRAVRWPAVGFLLVVLITLVWMVLSGRRAITMTPGIAFAALMVLGTPFAALAFAAWRATRHGYAETAEAVLAEGLCPSCGYNLHELVSDSPERVVCAECGAAWRRERIRRSAEFDSGAELRQGPFPMLAATRYRASRKKDDAAREVLVPMGLLTDAAADERLSDDMAALQRVRGKWRSDRRWENAGVAVGMVFVMGGTGVLGAGLTRLILGARDVGMAMIVAAGFVVIVLGCVVLRFTMRRSKRNAAGDLLSEGLCAGCFGALRGEKNGEGRVVCGYCGAEWRGSGIERGKT